ncbi:MAG TPA: hypothetical protein V6C89_21165 [Drouetiella sp.]|jgi:hypothetical protein
MKISKVVSISLSAITALTCSVGQVFAASIAIPGYSNTGATGIPAQCGSGSAQFASAQYMPLLAKLGVNTSSELNFAGLIVLAPNSAADPTDVTTLLPIPYQGNFTQQITGTALGNPNSSFAIQTYVAYSYVDGNGFKNYGVSPVPTQIAVIQTNQSIKGKSASAYAVGDTNLAGLASTGSLSNFIGNVPGTDANTFVLLGVGQGIFGRSASTADVSFYSPTLNQNALPGSSSSLQYPPVSGGSNVPVGKDTVGNANLNCSTFISSPVVPNAVR